MSDEDTQAFAASATDRLLVGGDDTFRAVRYLQSRLKVCIRALHAGHEVLQLVQQRAAGDLAHVRLAGRLAGAVDQQASLCGTCAQRRVAVTGAYAKGLRGARGARGGGGVHFSNRRHQASDLLKNS